MIGDEGILSGYQLDTLSQDATLNLLSAPLFHHQDPNHRDPFTQQSAPKDGSDSDLECTDYQALLCRGEVYALNCANNTNHLSLMDYVVNSYPPSTSLLPPSSTSSIPMEESYLIDEIESRLCYSPPRVAAPTPTTAPSSPAASPTPARDTAPLHHSEPIYEADPIPCSSPITKPFTVQCNEEDGTFHPDKLCRGARGKCIYYQSQWLTPNQFEYHTGRAQSKYWKRSLYAKGKSLIYLFRAGKLTEHDRSCTCGEAERRDEPKDFIME